MQFHGWPGRSSPFAKPCDRTMDCAKASMEEGGEAATCHRMRRQSNGLNSAICTAPAMAAAAHAHLARTPREPLARLPRALCGARRERLPVILRLELPASKARDLIWLVRQRAIGEARELRRPCDPEERVRPVILEEPRLA